MKYIFKSQISRKQAYRYCPFLVLFRHLIKITFGYVGKLPREYERWLSATAYYSHSNSGICHFQQKRRKTCDIWLWTCSNSTMPNPQHRNKTPTLYSNLPKKRAKQKEKATETEISLWSFHCVFSLRFEKKTGKVKWFLNRFHSSFKVSHLNLEVTYTQVLEKR